MFPVVRRALAEFGRVSAPCEGHFTVASGLNLKLTLYLSLGLNRPLPDTTVSAPSALPTTTTVATKASSSATIGPLITRVRTFLRTRASRQRFVNAIVIIHSNRALLGLNCNVTSLSRRVPGAPRAHFHVNSIDGRFATTTVLRLRSQNLLSIRTPIGACLPSCPRGAIALRRLLARATKLPGLADAPRCFR